MSRHAKKKQRTTTETYQPSLGLQSRYGSLAEHILNAVPQFSANLSVLVIRYLAHQFLYTIQPQGCVAHHIAPDYLFAFSSFNNTVCFQDRAGKQIGSEKLWDIKSSDGDTLYSTKQVQIKDGEMYSLQGWTYGAKHMAIYSMKDCALLHKFPVMKLASCFTIIPESGTIVVVSSNCISTYKRDGRVEGSAITNVHDAHGVAYYDKEIYISNLIRNEIQVFSLQNLEQQERTLNHGLRGPQGLAFDRAGNLYVADFGNDCVQILNRWTGLPIYELRHHLMNRPHRIVISSDEEQRIFVEEFSAKIHVFKF